MYAGDELRLKNFSRKPENKRPFGRSIRREEIILKWTLKKCGMRMRKHSSYSG
jgi:hypothetical protein